MDGEIIKELDETLVQLFGTMFFIALTPLNQIPPEEEWDAPGEYVEGMVTIQAKGQELPVHLYLPRQLAREVTINFLGIDGDEFDDSKMLDSVQETTNMTVGGLLGRIDPKALCAIGIPRATLHDDFSPAVIKQDGQVRAFRSDAGLLWVSCAAFEVCDTRCQ